jgi:dynein heavy chain
MPSGEREVLPCQTWIPRLLLRFLCEDPFRYAHRMAEAFYARKACEAELRYNLYIDCMPTDGIENVNHESLEKAGQWAITTPGLRDMKM